MKTILEIALVSLIMIFLSACVHGRPIPQAELDYHRAHPQPEQKAIVPAQPASQPVAQVEETPTWRKALRGLARGMQTAGHSMANRPEPQPIQRPINCTSSTYRGLVSTYCQ